MEFSHSGSADAKNQLQQRMCNGDSKKSLSYNNGQDLDLETRSLLPPSSPVNGGGVSDEEKRPRKGSTRRVRFNDCNLTQVLEFQPSSREDAVSLCAQLCTWLCGQRCRSPVTDT